ncbi:MAG: alpha/beta fold hydrolase [Chromatiaceae bacterium]|nr:alpha/beta fold hydrolase [Chromatiaceae bacterium]MCP5409026.1 alpha/beta fold hydrolase [Chromatiaceae bacterium]MCP5441917.1 alpha/beta fold hydrolase [Chromatiaceae bacterium]
MIIYLHGFSSSAASNKAEVFKRALAETRFLILDYPAHRPHAAVSSIARSITRALTEFPDEKVTLMGSSMGGFYAQFLAAELDTVKSVVLINPALQPQITLKPYIGMNTNMVTGEPFEFAQQDFEALSEYDKGSVVGKPTLVLLDEGDEVIDHRVAAQAYAAAGRVHVYPGGSHRFEHIEEAVAEIRGFMRQQHSVPD